MTWQGTTCQGTTCQGATYHKALAAGIWIHFSTSLGQMKTKEKIYFYEENTYLLQHLFFRSFISTEKSGPLPKYIFRDRGQHHSTRGSLPT